MTGFEFFLNCMIPPVLIIVGTVNNLLLFAVYSRKKFASLPTRNIWRVLAIIDIFCLVQITKYFSLNTFDYNLFNINLFTCKFIGYLTHCGIMSAWLVVYISLERMLSILLPKANKRLRKFQVLICIGIISFYILFYSQRLVYNGFIYSNSTTDDNTTNDTITTRKCTYLPKYRTESNVFKWIDTTLSTILPFILMFLCSIFLIVTVFNSRRRMASNKSGQKSKNNKKLMRDIKFSITLISLNFVFVAFKLPAIMFLSFGGSTKSVAFYILDDLYYTSYVINFYVFLASNSVFCQEFLAMIHVKKSRASEYVNNS